MPGILPMKVIKVGTSAQTRIAQACDRCRSKKIRCDGFRPCCSQCSNVGFECKTSDKLSRRAFPRGYTESLEERVRALECEVRELKDLLDEKDEKIDMLSKVHSSSPRPQSRRSSSIQSSTSVAEVGDELLNSKDDVFKVQQSPFLLEGEHSDSYFMGTSGGRALVDSFKRRLLENGRPGSAFNTDCFFSPNNRSTIVSKPYNDNASFWSPPPRLVSDQMVNVFFQEWAPLFPILHRPSFLTIYAQCVSGSHAVQDKRLLAQLNLVFAIAALSNNSRINCDVDPYERQWVAALDSFVKECSMTNLQSLLLAQLYCIQRADYSRLLHYKSQAVGISQRLGLHLSQKRFALGTLTIETRKKVFWTLYTLDCYTAAFLGLPKLIKDQDVQCEYPVDADDEYVSEKGFQPTLPGEYTKLSSALALFRCSRILSKVLDYNYPTNATHELSLRNIRELSDELEEWSDNLAPHLRLDFKQGKPSTSTISSRCPFLSLSYNYVRTLIHKPAACANINGNTASLVALASASKHIVQVMELIRERRLSFTFCLNQDELLTLAGFGLLLQTMDLDKDGKLLGDCQKSLCVVIEMLEKNAAPGSAEFKRLGCSLLSLNVGKSTTLNSPPVSTSPSTDEHLSLPTTRETSRKPSFNSDSDRRQSPLQARRSSNAKRNSRQITASASPGKSSSPTLSNKTPTYLAPSIKQSPKDSPMSLTSQSDKLRATRSPSFNTGAQPINNMTSPDINLDYFIFPSDPVPSPKQTRSRQTDTPDWDNIINSLDDSSSGADGGQIYSWPPVDDLLDNAGTEHSVSGQRIRRTGGEWSPKIWNFSTDTPMINSPVIHSPPQPPHSTFSGSDESLTSGEECSSVELEPSGDVALA